MGWPWARPQRQQPLPDVLAKTVQTASVKAIRLQVDQEKARALGAWPHRV